MKQENFLATGMFYHLGEFQKLGKPNPFYDYSKKELIDADIIDERVYEYIYTCHNIALEPEPTNPHDPNAIKVIVDGRHVAYIKKGSTSRVRKIMNAGIASITGEAHGGKYKCVYEDKGKYQVESGDESYVLRLTIIYNDGNSTPILASAPITPSAPSAPPVNDAFIPPKRSILINPQIMPKPITPPKRRVVMPDKTKTVLLCVPAFVLGLIALAAIILGSH